MSDVQSIPVTIQISENGVGILQGVECNALVDYSWEPSEGPQWTVLGFEFNEWDMSFGSTKSHTITAENNPAIYKLLNDNLVTEHIENALREVA